MHSKDEMATAGWQLRQIATEEGIGVEEEDAEEEEVVEEGGEEAVEKADGMA